MGDVAAVAKLHTYRMSAASRRYRLRVATALPARFGSWFPNLTSRTNADETTTVEGVVADSCQLAGIISAICHRNGEILSVEQMDSDLDPQD